MIAYNLPQNGFHNVFRFEHSKNTELVISP